MPAEPSFDAAMLNELTAVVDQAWELLPPEQRETTTRAEVARLVMLHAVSGVLDPETIVKSIVAGADLRTQDDA